MRTSRWATLRFGEEKIDVYQIGVGQLNAAQINAAQVVAGQVVAGRAGAGVINIEALGLLFQIIYSQDTGQTALSESSN